MTSGGHWEPRKWDDHMLHQEHIEKIPSTSIKATNEFYKNEGDFIAKKGWSSQEKKETEETL